MAEHMKKTASSKRVSFWKKYGISIGDLLGGVAGTAVAVPQSMGLGLVLFTTMGLDASTGAMAGLLGAAILSLGSGLVGATRGMISAPNGPVTMLLAASLATIAANGVEGQGLLLALSIILVLAGVLQFFIVVTGGVRLVKYIPFPAIAGLVTGIGILMILSQIRSLTDSVSTEVAGWWAAIPALTAVLTLVGIKLTRRFVPRLPGVIGGFLVGIVSFHLLTLALPESFPASWVVGDIPTLHGTPNIPEISAFRDLPWLQIMTSALAVGVLASVDCLLTAVVADGRTGARHNARRELAAQGAAQMLVGVLGGLGGGGTKGSTLVAIDSGGGRWAAVVAGLTFLSLLLFMGPVGQYLPISVLAGIIIYVGFSMIDVNILGWVQNRRLRMDAIVAITVVVVTLTYNLLAGLVMGIMGSVLLFIRGQLSQPVLHDRANGKQRRSLKDRSTEERRLLDNNSNRIVYVELRGNLFFGTADRLFTELMNDLERPVWMVVNMQRVQYIDTSAMHILRQMAAKLRRNGGTMIYTNVFKHSGGIRKINKAFRELGRVVGLPKVKTFRSTDAALEYAENKLLQALGWRPPAGSQRVDLVNNNLCVDLSRKTIKALSTVLRPLSLNRKDKVYIQGEHGEAIYLVLKGEVETRLPTGRYHYKRTSKIGAGGYFGTLSFLRPGPRSTTAIVTRKAQLLVLDRAALQTLEQRGEHKAALSILESITKNVACQLRWARDELVRLESG